MKQPEFKDDLESGIDYYDVLSIHERATPEEILAAFRLRIREIHPDVGGDHDAAACVLRARKVLTGTDRGDYDAARAARNRDGFESYLRAQEARKAAESRAARPTYPSVPPTPPPRPAPPHRVPGLADDLTPEEWAEADRWAEEWARVARGGYVREGQRREAADRSRRGPVPPASPSPRPSPPQTPGRAASKAGPAGFPGWDGGEGRRRHLEEMAAMEQRYRDMEERLDRERRDHAVDFERMKREYEEMKARADRRRASRPQSPRREAAGIADDFLAKTRAEADEILRKSRADADELVRRTRDATDEILRKSRLPRR